MKKTRISIRAKVSCGMVAWYAFRRWLDRWHWDYADEKQSVSTE